MKTNDAISRAAVLDVLSKYYPDAGPTTEQMLHRIWRNVKEIPAADVVPVVHGEWKYDENDYDDLTYSCSVCGEPWTLIDGTPQDNQMHYCPNCGAKMYGGAGNG